MHPVLFNLGPLAVRSYGVLIAISFAIGIYLAIRRGEKRGINTTHLTDLCIWIMISAVVGSRVMYILPYLDEFMADPVRVFAVWEGGLTMYGGLLAAVAVSVVFTRARKMPFWKVADVITPPLALGLGITRIGCFFNGCCFGHPTTCALGVRFPPHSAAGSEFFGVALHPTQLYNSLIGFGLFAFLLLVEKKVRGNGRLFLLFIGLYGIARFFMDRFRYYESASTIQLGTITLNWNQVVSLILFVGVVILYPRLKGEGHD